MEYLKLNCDGLDIEYEVLEPSDPRQAEIKKQINLLDERLDAVSGKIGKLDAEIKRLTNTADGLDYAVAVGCGVLTGIIDSVFVGKWDFSGEKANANRTINEKVKKMAEKSSGKDYTGKNRFDKMIKDLEKKYPQNGDGDYLGKTQNISAKTHRLDDYCHHPTIVGLISCIIRQFTGEATYHNDLGVKIPHIDIKIKNNYCELHGDNLPAKIFCAVWNWIIMVAKTTVNFRGHLYSDMATSAGIPGPILSILKEVSDFPGSKEKNFSRQLSNAFANGIGDKDNQLNLGIFNTLFEGADSKLDLRTEMAVFSNLKKQALPVIINECLVRAFYFFRHLFAQFKVKKSFKEVNWSETLPFRNRTIVRMLTISMGTMEVIDLADAAIRSAVKSGGNAVLFAKEAILRVNFVGLGRFIIAGAVDLEMGVRRQIKLNKKIYLSNEYLTLLNAKVDYEHSLMWIAAEEAEQAMQETKISAVATLEYARQTWQEYGEAFDEIATKAPLIEEKNPGLTDDIMSILGDD